MKREGSGLTVKGSAPGYGEEKMTSVTTTTPGHSCTEHRSHRNLEDRRRTGPTLSKRPGRTPYPSSREDVGEWATADADDARALRVSGDATPR